MHLEHGESRSTVSRACRAGERAGAAEDDLWSGCRPPHMSACATSEWPYLAAVFRKDMLLVTGLNCNDEGE